MARVGYVVSQYPAPSHTFIRREIAALRGRGLDVATFSVRRPHESSRLGVEDRAELAQTFYILPASITSLAGAHLWALKRSPGRYFRILRESLLHRVPGVRAFLWS